MEKIQERAFRFIYNDYTSKYFKLLEENGESTLYLKRVRIIAHEVYKAINGISPKYMNELLKTRTNTMRRPLDFYVPNVRQVTYGYRSFTFEAPTFWNTLPLEIREVENFKIFKFY